MTKGEIARVINSTFCHNVFKSRLLQEPQKVSVRGLLHEPQKVYVRGIGLKLASCQRNAENQLHRTVIRVHSPVV